MATSKIQKSSAAIESGTDGIWKYHKYPDGTYHAWYDGGINLLAGTATAGGYAHPQSSNFTPPSFSQSVTGFTAAMCGGGTLFAYMGCIPNYTTYWFNGAATAYNNIPVHADMYGTW